MSAATITVHVGDLVDLQGVVEESTNVGTGTNNLTVTQLNWVQILNTISQNNVIAPTIIGTGGRAGARRSGRQRSFRRIQSSHDAIDFYESVEGMLLTIKNTQVVSNSVGGATFIIPDNGTSSSGANDRGGVTNALGDVNPERFQIYADTGVTTGITASTPPATSWATSPA